MKVIVCKQCGASGLQKKSGYMICPYCGTTYQITEEDLPVRSSTIAINDDVKRLLEKCRKDPRNARRYANLILDIDPSNKEALRYL